MKFVERIIINLVRESSMPLDPKEILKNAAVIAEMEAVRCDCAGKYKRAIKLRLQAVSCITAAAKMATDNADDP